ncbi:MAG: ribosome maturation factor RimP [Gemmatimonadales bacterium]|jgi:ribosome maturation factor RimP
MKELERIAESVLERMGLELVDLERVGHRARPILRLRIDRPESRPGSGVTVDDCAAVSRALDEVLEERADELPSYILEVSSPGIERPLKKRRDFELHVGEDIVVRGFQALAGRSKHVEGQLLAIEDDEAERLRLRLGDGSEIAIPLSAVAKANLVYRWEDGLDNSGASRAAIRDD